MPRLTTILLIVSLSGCVAEHPEPQIPTGSAAGRTTPKTATAQALTVEEMTSPAGPGSGEPFLFASADGQLLLSWLEPVKESNRYALRFASRLNGAWSAPRTIVERDDLFVNWADFPSVVRDARGVLFAQWLQKSGSDRYAYDTRMSISSDGGVTWSRPFLLNRDGREAEHGFATLAPLPGGGVGAAWLDGRTMTAEHHGGGHDGGEMELRYATVSADGSIAGDQQIDGRTCECCTTGMAMTANGAVVVYRDRSEKEIRDIAAVSQTASGWSAPAIVHADGWKITGCPVNGPQIDALEKSAAVAWFTGAEERQRVLVAFSGDGGVHFEKAVQIDDGKPLGRVDVVMIDPDTAMVSWLEQTPGGAEIRARRVKRQGPPESSLRVGTTTSARAAGFARMARSKDSIQIAWTDQDRKDQRIRIAGIALAGSSTQP